MICALRESDVVGTLAAVSVKVLDFTVEFHAIDDAAVHVPCLADEDFVEVIFSGAGGEGEQDGCNSKYVQCLFHGGLMLEL